MSGPGGIEIDTKRIHRAFQVTQPSHSVIWRTLMDPQGQFCHNPDCSERGVVGRGNIVIHSRAEQRYQCRRCKRTFR